MRASERIIVAVGRRRSPIQLGPALALRSPAACLLRAYGMRASR